MVHSEHEVATVRVHGILLAGGAGTRMGKPKVLVSDRRGPWLTRACSVLSAGGCRAITVVLGADAAAARKLVPTGVGVVEAADWATGLSASLRSGILSVNESDDDAVAIHLVDLPDISAAVVRRVTNMAGPADVLARASFLGRPGHPVLAGRDHWQPMLDSLVGDEGAGAYLRRNQAALVECGDLAAGFDVDSPEGVSG